MPTGGLQFKDQLEELDLGRRTKFSESVTNFLQNKINFSLCWSLVYPALTHKTGNACGIFHFGETVLCATIITTTPPHPAPLSFFYSQALKILPACLKIFKIQGFLTGAGVANQNRVGGEKN